MTHGLYAAAGQHHLRQAEEDQNTTQHSHPDTGTADAAQDEALPEAGVRIDPSRSEVPEQLAATDAFEGLPRELVEHIAAPAAAAVVVVVVVDAADYTP